MQMDAETFRTPRTQGLQGMPPAPHISRPTGPSCDIPTHTHIHLGPAVVITTQKPLHLEPFIRAEPTWAPQPSGVWGRYCYRQLIALLDRGGRPLRNSATGPCGGYIVSRRAPACRAVCTEYVDSDDQGPRAFSPPCLATLAPMTECWKSFPARPGTAGTICSAMWAAPGTDTTSVRWPLQHARPSGVNVLLRVARTSRSRPCLLSECLLPIAQCITFRVFSPADATKCQSPSPCTLNGTCAASIPAALRIAYQKLGCILLAGPRLNV
ncbi:hypothetical protein C8Q76DRAFT_235577 [Earliella scabrosa]|nr:hypothetical protein C8Q76DRAFT_235577 [Earliella scabrosa]